MFSLKRLQTRAERAEDSSCRRIPASRLMLIVGMG